MPKVAKELRALDVSRLNQPGNHAVGGVTGLYLYVTQSLSKSWVLRTMIGGKRRHMGLGSYPTVGLAQAREKAREAREQIANGIDPIAERQSMQSQLQAQQAKQVTFAQAASAYIEAHQDSWKNAKHRAQWSSTLETYAYPVMRNLLVADVALTHILQVLEPIWGTKTETANRLRGRIENVIDWATARGYREGENPARWKGHLDKLLASPTRLQKTKHHKAVPVKDMPAFFAELQNRGGAAARALQFAIYCASRSGEVRGATWEEIDWEEFVWIVPANRMKAGVEHRVPLSYQALALLKRLPRLEGTPYLFPSNRGTPLSDASLLAVMKRMKVDAVPHGFRSTFRDWVGDMTDYPRELAEHALAHTLINKVEAAYRRGDGFDKRRKMMEKWADFCHGVDVVPMQNLFKA